MRSLLPPAIDPRSAATVAAKVRELLAGYVPDWKPDKPDPGQALVGIFAHFAGIIIDRLNRTPDKAFLAFLDLIGAARLPPEPARAPLTFHLAAGATTDARVPAASRVAATAGQEEADPPVFETTGELFLTGAELVAAYVRDPDYDAWSDLTGLIGSAARAAQGVAVFRGDRAIERRLWISHRMFAGQGPRDVTIKVAARDADAALPELEWGWWDGTAWQPFDKSAIYRTRAGGLTLTIKGLRPVPETLARSANGSTSTFRGAWIGGRLPHTELGKPFALPTQRVTAIEVSTSIERDQLIPDAVFSGTTAIDASKDFLPFGERPKLGDAFLLACNEAFAEAGPVGRGKWQRITLKLTASDLDRGRLSPPDPKAKDEEKVTLTWEYWNGSRWRTIGQSDQSSESVGGDAEENAEENFKFKDATRAFMALKRAEPSEVSFRRPGDWKPSAVAGQSNYWIRVRISAGGYGHDAGYLLTETKNEKGEPVKGYVLDPATWRPPSLRDVSVAYSYTSPSLPPDRVLVEGSSFGLTDQTAKELSAALASAGNDTTPSVYLAFRRPGAAVAFANQPVSLYVGVDENTGQTHARDDGAAARPPEIAWEYRNALGWRSLGAEDETAGFSRRGLVTFIGPADIVATSEFGLTACWLRARWVGGSYVVPPRVNRFVTNTVWAHHATSIAREIVGSGNAEPGQVFRTSMTPVLTGQYVEVGEPEPPAAADRAALEAEEETDCVTIVTDDNGQAVEVWVRWHEVPDFYGSLPGSRHYTIDRLSGAIRFGGEGRGRAPPRGLNNIRISYHSGGGSVGNRPAGTITQLKSAIPYVDSVTNPEGAAGGADAQSLEEVRRHAPAMLRHQGRAIAIADYEDLAFRASPAVARAKGIPAHTAKDAGRVELVVVPLSSASRPMPSLELLQQVEDYVTAFAPPTVDLIVRGPDWLEISVSVELVPTSFERAMALREIVRDRLSAFLNPLTGALDGRGWEFGRRPHRSDFYGLIEAIPDVDHIRALIIKTLAGASPDGAATLVHAGDLTVTLVASATHNA